MDPYACVRDMLDYIRAGELVEAYHCLQNLREWRNNGGVPPLWQYEVARWFERNLKCDQCEGELEFTQTSDWTRRPGMGWCAACKRVVE